MRRKVNSLVAGLIGVSLVGCVSTREGPSRKPKLILQEEIQEGLEEHQLNAYVLEKAQKRFIENPEEVCGVDEIYIEFVSGLLQEPDFKNYGDGSRDKPREGRGERRGEYGFYRIFFGGCGRYYTIGSSNKMKLERILGKIRSRKIRPWEKRNEENLARVRRFPLPENYTAYYGLAFPNLAYATALVMPDGQEELFESKKEKSVRRIRKHRFKWWKEKGSQLLKYGKKLGGL